MDGKIEANLEDVITEMCDKYCRFPAIFDDEDKMIEQVCNDCPLNDL